MDRRFRELTRLIVTKTCETCYYAPAPNKPGHKAMMLSDVCLSDLLG